MSIPQFPTASLGFPLASNYKVERTVVSVHETTQDGLPVGNNFSVAPLAQFSVRWNWTASQYAAFVEWYRYDCKAGASAFTINGLLLDAEYSEVEVRFTGATYSVKVSDSFYVVSATLETADADYISEAELDAALPTEPRTDGISWPVSLFGAPLDAWSEAPTSSTDRGSTAGYALPVMRRRSPTQIVQGALKLEMTNVQRKLCAAWIHYKLKDGAGWFWLNCNFQGVLQDIKVRLTAPIEYTYKAILNWGATMRIETVSYAYLPLDECPTLRPDLTRPLITNQPDNLNIALGEDASFAVEATSDSTMTYQWYFNGALIQGATSATYAISGAAAANEGDYQVRVSNSAGSSYSRKATLHVRLVYIEVQPEDVAAHERDVVEIPAQVQGADTITWYKDGTPISLLDFGLISDLTANIVGGRTLLYGTVHWEEYGVPKSKAYSADILVYYIRSPLDPDGSLRVYARIASNFRQAYYADGAILLNGGRLDAGDTNTGLYEISSLKDTTAIFTLWTTHGIIGEWACPIRRLYADDPVLQLSGTTLRIIATNETTGAYYFTASDSVDSVTSDTAALTLITYPATLGEWYSTEGITQDEGLVYAWESTDGGTLLAQATEGLQPSLDTVRTLNGIRSIKFANCSLASATGIGAYSQITYAILTAGRDLALTGSTYFNYLVGFASNGLRCRVSTEAVYSPDSPGNAAGDSSDDSVVLLFVSVGSAANSFHSGTTLVQAAPTTTPNFSTCRLFLGCGSDYDSDDTTERAYDSSIWELAVWTCALTDDERAAYVAYINEKYNLSIA